MPQALRADEILYIHVDTYVPLGFSRPGIFYAYRGDFKSASSSQGSTAGNVQAFDHRLVASPFYIRQRQGMTSAP